MSVGELLEPGNDYSDFDSVDETGGKYDLPTDYDFRTEADLQDGAVAATAKVPGMRIKEMNDYEDFLEADKILYDDEGQLYSAKRDELTGFIADQEVYSELNDELLEHVNLHEIQHFLQYSEGLWGDKLDEIHDLSDPMKYQLNEVDRLMTLKEHPVYRNLINDEKATAIIEGYTERVTQAMQENGEEYGQAFYPEITDQVDHLMKNRYGTDPEKEFNQKTLQTPKTPTTPGTETTKTQATTP